MLQSWLEARGVGGKGGRGRSEGLLSLFGLVRMMGWGHWVGRSSLLDDLMTVERQCRCCTFTSLLQLDD